MAPPTQTQGMEDFVSDVEEVKLLEDVKGKMEDAVVEAPDWLPDGWIMEVQRGDDGALYKYFISPVSGAKFRMKSDVLNYLFSEMDEHYLEAKDSVDHKMLPAFAEFVPKGGLFYPGLQSRTTLQNFFYVYPALGVRAFSKEDILLYVNEMKIRKCDTNGQCDTSSRDNILAEVEFNPSGLPDGWVKEMVYRKTLKGTRKDSYYTDPVSRYAFRTLTSIVRFLRTGNISKRSFIQRTSVHELYNFDKSADLHESLHKRLTKNVMNDKTNASPSRPRRSKKGEKIDMNEQNSDEDVNTSADLVFPNEHQEIKKKNMKANQEEAYSSRTIKRPRGSPPKVARQTEEDISKKEE
ncbi:hypothetical protein VPH35_125804 [Triticum aestivum]